MYFLWASYAFKHTFMLNICGDVSSTLFFLFLYKYFIFWREIVYKHFCELWIFVNIQNRSSPKLLLLIWDLEQEWYLTRIYWSVILTKNKVNPIIHLLIGVSNGKPSCKYLRKSVEMHEVYLTIFYSFIFYIPLLHCILFLFTWSLVL